MSLSISLSSKTAQLKPLKFLQINENFCGNFYSYQAIANAAMAVGHKWVWAHGDSSKRTPILDLVHIHPDIDILSCPTYVFDESFVKAVSKWRENNPNFKVLSYGSSCGKYTDNLPKDYPIVKRTDYERKIVSKIKPDLIWHHIHPSNAELTMSGWKKDGYKITGIMNCGDIIQYGNGQYNDYLASDIGYVGGYWGWKAKTGLDKFLIPLCHPSKKIKVKIFGNTGWPVAQYLGPIKEELTGSFFKSCKVCPSVSEPHSRSHGIDSIERPSKVIIAGGFCVSDYVQTFKDHIFGDSLPMSNDPNEYIDMIEFYLKNDDKREEVRLACYQKVIGGHTNLHRLNWLFTKLGMPERKFDVRIAA